MKLFVAMIVENFDANEAGSPEYIFWKTLFNFSLLLKSLN